MNATETRAVIERYFDLMGRGEDFGVCYADDVAEGLITCGRLYGALGFLVPVT